MVESGRLTPLRSDSLPPTIDARASCAAGSASVTMSRSLPSSISSVWPGSTRGEDLRMRQIDARRVARRRIGVEHEAVAVLHLHRAAGEGAEPQLRPLQIDQDADRAAGVALDAADRRRPVRACGPGWCGSC